MSYSLLEGVEEYKGEEHNKEGGAETCQCLAGAQPACPGGAIAATALGWSPQLSRSGAARPLILLPLVDAEIKMHTNKK